MAANNNSICPSDAIPEPINLGIPGKAHGYFAVTPSKSVETTGDPDSWMVACCKPNPVHLVGDGNCWQWCDIPSKFTTNVSSDDPIVLQFSGCLRENGRSLNYTNDLVIDTSGASPKGIAGGELLGAAMLFLVLWHMLCC